MMRRKEKSNFLKNIKRTWQYMKSSKWNLFVYASASVLEGVIGIVLPLISAKIILNLTDGLMNQLMLTALAVLLIELFLYILFYFKSSFYQKIYQKTLVDLQMAVARETLKIEVSEMDKVSTGVFIDRLNKDTEEIASMFMEYTFWISQVVSHIGIVFAIFAVNKYLFIYALFTGIVIFIINKKKLDKRSEVRKSLKKIRERKTGLTSELVRGIRDIKVLNAEHSILKQTESSIVRASKEEIKMMNISRVYQYIEENVRAISDFLFIVFGCFLYKEGLLTIPIFVIVYNYQGKVKSLLTGVSKLLEYSKQFIVSSDRIFEIIEDDTFKKEKFGTITRKKLSGHILFDHVSFQYKEDSPILNKMSFEIYPNEKVAFVGKSGVGKTTIFNLITKLYSVTDGCIYLDGHAIEDLTCDTLRNNMSIITQNPYIFNFSIKENLLLAKEDASMEEIRTACKLACIDEYIMSLPDAYDTMVGENGVILSGGQKQRLAIARALLMKTEIILFDEATSALDNETQGEIQNAIANLKGEYTILIVAHRLSTIIDSDKIFVVEGGKVLAQGTHKELLKSCSFYKGLYEKDLQV